MPTHHFPALVWADFTGHFTARLVEDEEAPAAFGATAADALFQLKEYLDWLYQNQPGRAAPDFQDARLIEVRVEVRPEYQEDNRIYPSEEPLILRVPCVYGRTSTGALTCALPTLGVRFFYNKADELKNLVTHYARERLRAQPPSGVARFLPPKQVALEEIGLHVNRKERSYRYTPTLETLETVAEPLGDKKLRRHFARAWQREPQVADLIRRLGSEKANVILVGEGGAGKTSVLIEAVRHLEATQVNEDDDESEGRARFKYWQTAGARLIAGMQYLGEWQERCERVIEELAQLSGVLCLENLLDLLRTGSGNVNESLGAYFMPYLQRGELRLVAEATPPELDACRRLLPGFVDLFQILPLPAFNRTQALTVLKRVATNHSRNLKLAIAEEVPATLYRLFHRFQPYQAFPGKVIFFLNNLAERAARDAAKTISVEEVIAQFIRQMGLPEVFLREEIPLTYNDVLTAFRAQVIGQEAACAAAAQLVTTFKAGLNDPQRPLGVLLFCGPTGVGKTELARALARYFFGHGEPQDAKGDRLVRLDLSEYAGWGAAQRLLIGPDGEPSEFIKQVRHQPFCVVLLDEIEKAHAAVFDVLLSVFDEGRLTDVLGRVTTFRSAVIVMTSNLGADKLETVGFETRGAPSYTREAMSFFRPEFFNRLDAIVQFNPLSAEMMRAITAKELRELAAREGLQRNGLRLEWEEDLIEHLITLGFDHRYGARPLQRTIEATVVAPLAKYLLAHPGLKNTSLRLTLAEGNQLRCTAAP